METKADPGKRLDIDMYTQAHLAKGAKKLPIYLIDAIREFSKDKILGAALGPDFAKSYITIKTREWNDYARHLTEWERANTLDC